MASRLAEPTHSQLTDSRRRTPLACVAEAHVSLVNRP